MLNGRLNAESGIAPAEFVKKMEHHWTRELQNVPNDALRETWRQIAEAFGEQISNHDNPDEAKKWTILSPPTGSGKTESTVIYGAMLSGRDKDDHPGMLIVTRLIEDCNTIAERINHFGSETTAIAYHSDVAAKFHSTI